MLARSLGSGHRLASWAAGGLLAVLLFLPFLIPWVVREPLAVTYLNIAFGLVFLLAIAAVISSKDFRFAVPPWHLTTVVVGLLVALAYAMLVTVPLSDGFGLWANRLLQPLAIGFITLQFLERRWLTVDQLMRIFLCSVLPVAFYGLLQLGGVAFLPADGRLNVLYGSANDLARFVSTILLVTLPWLVITRPRPTSGFWAVWLLGSVVLFATQSYGGVASTAIAGLLVVWLLPVGSVGLRRSVVLIAVAGLVVLGVYGRQLPQWQTKVDTSLQSRQEFWLVARGVIRDHFWTGIGIKTWEQEYPNLVTRYGTYPPISQQSPQPHNVYLDSFVKAGFPGFLGIISFLLWPLVAGLALFFDNRSQSTGWIGLSLVAFGSAMAIWGLIDDPLWADDAMVLIFVLYALLGWAYRNTPARSR